MKTISVLTILLSLSTFAHAGTYTANQDCVEYAKREFRSSQFGPATDADADRKFDEDDYTTLCLGSDDKKSGAKCVKEMYAQSQYSNMRPAGLATVCSQGSSSDDAAKCLQVASQYFGPNGWARAVDACNWTTLKFGNCTLPSNLRRANLKCHSDEDQAAPQSAAGSR